jgi:NAD(P)-dependent dehydrogenase (short-subunit alcohol dehydrogenase family)
MGRLDNKVAIITGGGSGIGQASALLFAKEGAKVVIACRNTAGNGEKTVAMIKETGGEAIFVKTDISEVADVENMIATTINTYGKLNVLFNNAGLQGPFGLFTADLPVEVADRTIAVNFRGVFLATKFALPELLKSVKNGGASIITTSSICAYSACTGAPVYAGTKGAVVAFSQTVAIEYASYGLRANTISPAASDTPGIAEIVESGAGENLAKQIPLQRLGAPEDSALAALYLASDDSEFITGTNIMVDGGWRVRGPS